MTPPPLHGGLLLGCTVTPGCGPCSGTRVSFNDISTPGRFVVYIPVLSYWFLPTCSDICALNSLCAVYNPCAVQTI